LINRKNIGSGPELWGDFWAKKPVKKQILEKKQQILIEKQAVAFSQHTPERRLCGDNFCRSRCRGTFQ
jgi:hypothetical protein